jgi:hypothetical protein
MNATRFSQLPLDSSTGQSLIQFHITSVKTHLADQKSFEESEIGKIIGDSSPAVERRRKYVLQDKLFVRQLHWSCRLLTIRSATNVMILSLPCSITNSQTAPRWSG